MKIRFLFLTVVLIFTIASKPSAAQPTTSAAPATAAKSGGVLKIINSHAPVQFGYPSKIQGPDQTFASPCFDNLLTVGDGGVYQPALATSWDVAADGKTITFKLRRGVKFHDGTPFNAQAVKFNFDLLLAPNPIKPLSPPLMIIQLKLILPTLTTWFCIK
jgi:ABC-type transport system substrate-binding protein